MNRYSLPDDDDRRLNTGDRLMIRFALFRYDLLQWKRRWDAWIAAHRPPERPTPFRRPPKSIPEPEDSRPEQIYFRGTDQVRREWLSEPPFYSPRSTRE